MHNNKSTQILCQQQWWIYIYIQRKQRNVHINTYASKNKQTSWDQIFEEKVISIQRTGSSLLQHACFFPKCSNIISCNLLVFFRPPPGPRHMMAMWATLYIAYRMSWSPTHPVKLMLKMHVPKFTLFLIIKQQYTNTTRECKNMALFVSETEEQNNLLWKRSVLNCIESALAVYLKYYM